MGFLFLGGREKGKSKGKRWGGVLSVKHLPFEKVFFHLKKNLKVVLIIVFFLSLDKLKSKFFHLIGIILIEISMGENDDVTNFEQSEYGSTVGLILAIISTIFIGSSFIVKKKALIKISNRGNVRASAGGYGYLSECVWWVGLLLSKSLTNHHFFLFYNYENLSPLPIDDIKIYMFAVGIGELANFAAFAFAPATLVAPLGALSVLVSSILASKFLNEKLNILGKIGCVLCIIGSTVIIIHSPKKDKIQTMESIIENMEQLTFLSYLFIVAIIFLSIFFYFGPKYGQKNALVYILMCSAVGSLTVLACKGLGIAIQDSIRNEITDLINTFNFFLIITIIVCIVTQMNYLNKALDLFNTAIVTPVYYVLFTIFVVTSSTILYSEWENLNYDDVIGNVCGFLTVVAAIFLLNGFRDLDIGLNDVQTTVKNKQWDNGSAMRVCVKKQQTKYPNNCLSRLS